MSWHSDDYGVLPDDGHDSDSRNHDGNDNDDAFTLPWNSAKTPSVDTPSSESAESAKQPIETNGDAREIVENLHRIQVQRAIDEKVLPNMPVYGDDVAKRAFYTLLPRMIQREVFMRFATDMNQLQRIRTLFGAPPYWFLHDSDAGMLRAAGFAHGRSNMAYSYDRFDSTYNQFGTPQFTDEDGREYRTMQMDSENNAPIGALMLRDGGSSKGIVLGVRIKKMNKRKRDDHQSLPRIGALLSLTETSAHQRIRQGNAPIKVSVRAMKYARSGDLRANTAGLVVRIA